MPSTIILPEVGLISEEMSLVRTVLPDPDPPMITTDSPSVMERLMFFSISVFPNDFDTFLS